jgi:hypothetical protein
MPRGTAIPLSLAPFTEPAFCIQLLVAGARGVGASQLSRGWLTLAGFSCQQAAQRGLHRPKLWSSSTIYIAQETLQSF